MRKLNCSFATLLKCFQFVLEFTKYNHTGRIKTNVLFESTKIHKPVPQEIGRHVVTDFPFRSRGNFMNSSTNSF